MNELKRLLNRKILLVFMAFIIINVFLYTYQQTRGTGLKELRNSTDQEEQLEYIKHYSDDIRQIQINAQQLMTFSIFADKDSFTYNNILKTAKDFGRVSDVSLYPVNCKATENFVKYYYTFYFSMLMMVFIIYELSGERDNEMWGIVHAAGGGRQGLALRRFLIIVVSGVAITAGLYITTFAASLFLYGGTESLNAPVQSIPAFSRFSLPMSQIEFVLYNYVYSTFAIIVLSVVLWAVFVVNRKRNHALIITGIFAGLEVFMYFKIPGHSVYAILRKINLVRLMKVNEIISTYANHGRGTFVISESAIMLITLIVLLCTAGVIAFAGTVLMRPQQHKSLLAGIAGRISEGYQHVLGKMPVFMKELHKLLITSRGITVIAVLLIVVLYFVSYGKMTFSDNAMERDKIYLEKGGADYSQITEMIQERKDDYIGAVQLADEASVKYENGEISMEDFSEINSAVLVYSSRYSAVREFQEKCDYLDSLKEDTGIAGYMMSERGYEEIFGDYGKVREIVILIALLVSVVLIVSENIGIETSTGTKYIVEAASGKHMIKVKRIAASAVLCMVLFVIVYGIDMWCMYRYYGMPYLAAPLMSLMFMRDSGFYLTIGTFIIIRLLIRLVIMIVVFAFTYILCSRFTGVRGRMASICIIIGAIVFCIIYGNMGL